MLDFLISYLFWLTLLFSSIYIYVKDRVFNYWKRHGIPYEEPGLLLGNIPFSHFFKEVSIGTFLRNSFEKFHQYPFYGFYAFYRPVLVINDPELIRTVLVQEFSSFPDRGWYSNKDIDLLSGHLFLLTGEKWKRLRKNFSPMFSPANLKQMYNLIVEVSNNLIDACNAKMERSTVIEVKDLIDRYTIDIISSMVYGLDANSLKNADSELLHYANELFDFGKLILLMAIFIPTVLKKCFLPMNKNNVQNYFLETFENSIIYRRNTKVTKMDMLNILMKLIDNGKLENNDEVENLDSRNEKENNEKLSINEAAAQSFVFFAAGYDTASSTVAYCLYELALNHLLQDRLRKEIDDIYKASQMTYDTLKEMEYLNMVFLETLRKHPAVPFLNRICVKDFRIPGSNFTVPKGMPIVISISGINSNPEYFPNPEIFDAQNFTKEKIASRSNYLQLGFGEGPRYCIGKRLGELQAKQAIITVIRNFRLDICSETEIPVRYTSRTFVQRPRAGIYLRFQKR